MSLCHAEGYPSYTEDPERTWQALTNPGVTTVVADWEGRVVGAAQMLSDGVIQAFLVIVLVHPDHRRGGLGRGLIEHAFARAGGSRVDLLAEEGAAVPFYERFAHRRKPGFRLYPEPPAD